MTNEPKKVENTLELAMFMYVTLITEADKWLTFFKGHPAVTHKFKFKVEQAILSNKALHNHIKGENNLQYFEHVGEMFSEALDKIRNEKDVLKQQELLFLIDDWIKGNTVNVPDDTESIMTKSEVIDFVQHITKGSALTKEIIINSYNTFKNDK